MSPRTDQIPVREILVVDDDEGILNLAREILEHEGYRVDTASSSRDALGRARSKGYDLVILDLILPDTDGVILRNKLKRLMPGIEGRTIFMTGFTSKDPVLDYLRSVSTELIHKPFRPDDLLQAVGRILQEGAPCSSWSES